MVILGKDGQEYTSVKECLVADAAYDKKIAEEEAKKLAAKKAEEAKIAEKKAEISKRKKELSTAIELATDKVKVAKVEYNQAKEKAEKIMAEARKASQSILEEAGNNLKRANEEKVKAISNFNKEFGRPFTTVLTGDDAWDEYVRIRNNIDKQFDIFRNIFNIF